MAELEPPLHGDRPLKSGGVDLLGFQDLARELARALATRAATEGMVIGIEGKWGSGKSSLVTLIIDELNKIGEANRPIILNFQPWLIGSRDALIASFFDELAKTVADAKFTQGDATGVSLLKAEDLTRDLRRYAGYVGALAPVAALASILSVPGAGFFSRLADASKAFSKEAKVETRPLEEIKSAIEKALARLSVPIIVFVDDVDRLDPTETAELLRLIRSVADFPKVTYVLCFDPQIVGEAVTSAVKVSDGRAYLEKIFQMTIRVPAPEPFALRKMFELGLGEFMILGDRIKAQRLAELIDTKGGAYLTTPRAVNRTLDALRFSYPILKGKIDEPDLVWLTFIRLNNPMLYEWIEDYLATMAAISSGRVSVTGEGAKSSYKTLLKALDLGDGSDEKIRVLLDFAPYMPGFDTFNLNRQDEIPIFKRVSEADRGRTISERRLASPDHYRYYFALTIPSAAPREDEFREFFAAANGGDQPLSSFLRAKAASSAGPLGTRLEIILDRIRTSTGEQLDSNTAKAMLLALADILDEPEVVSDADSFLGPQLWREAELLLPQLKRALGASFKQVLAEAFQNGRALGWMTNILRHETFSHGRFGDQREPDNKWILSDDELDLIVSILIPRFEALGVRGVLKLPQGLSALFGWLQAGNPEDVKSRIEALTRSDAGFLDFLEALATTTRSSAGDYQSIRKDTLDPLLSYDDATERVATLSTRGDEVGERAMTMKKMFEAGQRW